MSNALTEEGRAEMRRHVLEWAAVAQSESTPVACSAATLRIVAHYLQPVPPEPDGDLITTTMGQTIDLRAPWRLPT